MQLSQPFNPRSVQPASADGGGGQLPVGEWPVVITGHDIKATQNDSNAGMLVLDLQITQGPHTGQTGKWRLGIYHTNPQTKEIAFRQLSSLCYVVGWMQDLVDVSVLHGKQFLAVIQPQTTEEGRAKGYTQVQGVKDMNGNDPGKQHQQTQQQQPQGGPPQGWNPAGGGQQQPQQQTQQPQGGPSWGGGGATQQQPPQGGGGATQWGNNGGGQQTQQPQGGGQQWTPGQGGQQPQGGAPAGAAPWRT